MDTEKHTHGFLVTDGWAGITKVPVKIEGETPKKYLVMLEGDCRLPGKRIGKKGEVILVPKYAVRMEKRNGGSNT